MDPRFIRELESKLSVSDARLRKHWATRIISERISLESLFSLWHAEPKTAQRFMWLIGDLSDLCPNAVEPCLPFLIGLRDQMPFPGMHRSIAKWLHRTGVPKAVQNQAVEVLLNWLSSPVEEIGTKSYSAMALVELASAERIPKKRLVDILDSESKHENRAYGKRILKQLERIR